MTTIRESGFVLKIATGAAIGVTDESLLDPANMSSGSATLGQVPSADGAGGITWSDEIGPVPSGRQILNGTGITGGGDLSADRTLSVVQSALDPANQSSGSATAGQYPRASGGGAIAWQDLPASVTPAPSSTDHALARFDGTGGDTLQNSNVTLSDTDAMVFPAAGSISKPGSGVDSEAFGADAVAAAQAAVVVGKGAAVYPVNSGNSASAIAVGRLAEIGNATPAAGCDAAIAIGERAKVNPGATFAIVVGSYSASYASRSIAVGPASKVYDTSSGDNEGAMAIGYNAIVGSITPGAGCDAAIALGRNTVIHPGSADSIALGQGAQIGPSGASASSIAIGDTSVANSGSSVAIGTAAQVFTSSSGAVAIGDNARVLSSTTSGIAIGKVASVAGNDTVAIGHDADVYGVSSGDSIGSVAIGAGATVGAVSPGAGCNAAICIGENSLVQPGATDAVVIGTSAEVNPADAIAIGRLAVVRTTTSGDSIGAIAIGRSATIGNGTAGCNASIAIGEGTLIAYGAYDCVSLGADADIGNGAYESVCIGEGAIITSGSYQSVVIGQGANISTTNDYRCTLIGQGATASGTYATVVGQGASAISTATVFGQDASGQSAASVVLGRSAIVHPVSSGDSSGAICIGHGAAIGNATPGAGCDAAIVVGYNSVIGVGATDAIAIGDATAIGTNDINSIAVGSQAQSTHQDAVAIGASAQAGFEAVAIGKSASASVGYAIAVGSGATINTSASECIAIGHNATLSTASSDYGIAIGTDSSVLAQNGVAIGYGALTSHDHNVAIGYSCAVFAAGSGDSDSAIAIGRFAKVGTASPAAGCDAGIAIGQSASVGAGHQNAVAIGLNAATTASNRVNFAAAFDVQIGQGLGVWGATPPGSQPSKINDPSGGTTVDAEARSAINAILDVLEGAGLSSPT